MIANFPFHLGKLEMEMEKKKKKTLLDKIWGNKKKAKKKKKKNKRLNKTHRYTIAQAP
jgi:hypothetical protein